MKTNPPDVCNEIPLEQTTSPTHVHATRSTLLPRFKRKGYKGIFNSKIIGRFDFKGYDLPGIREGDGKSFLKWVKHPGTTDFPEFSICMRCFFYLPVE